MKQLPSNLDWSILKNASTQLGGRLLLSLARLGVAVIVVRYAGAERFGEYVVVLTMVAIAEWMVDFGFTDISVRNICRNPDYQAGILKTLMLWKLGLIAVSSGLLVLALYVLGYPETLVRAGAVGGFAVLAYGGALVYRVVFRSRMAMEKDVAGEVAGVLVMLPLTWWAARSGAGVDVLVGCYAVSRLVYLGASRMLAGTGALRAGVVIPRAERAPIFRQALPLGVAGLLVCLSDSLAPIFLSKLMDMRSVAYYSAALRFVLPAIIGIQALGSAFYPVLSSFWRQAPERFAKTQQLALESAIIVATAMFCGVHGASSFLMGLLGPEMAGAEIYVRVLSVVILAKAVTTIMAPMVIVSGAQKVGLWLTVLSVGTQFLVLAWLVPPYGIYGAVAGFLVVEFAVTMLTTVIAAQRLAGHRVRWSRVLRAVLAGVAALAVVKLVGLQGSLLGGIAAVILFGGLAFATGAVSAVTVRSLRDSLRDRPAAAPERQ